MNRGLIATRTLFWKKAIPALRSCVEKKIIEPRRDFQQCGILTSVDSDEPVSLLLSLDTPNNVQSVEYSSD